MPDSFYVRLVHLLAVALVTLPLVQTISAQGNLTPPGAPAPTMKTLEQIEPRIDLQNAPASAVTTTDANFHFIINQPGSYYLSANLEVTKPHGIRINADGVTLDLNGFEISRASGSGGLGIDIAFDRHRASVRNGSFKGFTIGVGGVGARACVFRDLSVSGCTNFGIRAGGGAVLESCRADDNSGSAGIYAAAGSSLINCTATNNTATHGISADSGSSLTNCSATGNTGTYGIFAQAGSSLTNCSARANTSAAAVSAGIATGVSCTISHCTAVSNTSTVGTPTPSTGMGFDVGLGSTIHNSTAGFNQGNGIKIFLGTSVRDNNCYSNGNGGDGAGIHAIGNINSPSSSNRIEGNNVTLNDRGIDVGGAGNLILKNSARGNTGSNYAIVGGNRYGPIVDLTASGAVAANGNAAASTLTGPGSSSDPWTNFAY